MIASDSDFGSIFSDGPATLDGTLDILLGGDFIPAVGESFTILSFNPGTLSGTFASIENEFFNNGTEQWAVIYDNTDGDLLLTAEAVPPPSVPEPSTMFLGGSSLLAMAYWISLRRQRQGASGNG
jgi:hypothetical protein